MTLKEFLEKIYKENPKFAMETMTPLLQIESAERFLNVLWGVELEINVKESEPKESNFYGRNLINELYKSAKKFTK